MASKLPNVRKPDSHSLLAILATLPGVKGMRTVIQTWAVKLRFWGARVEASRTTVTIEGAETDERK